MSNTAPNVNPLPSHEERIASLERQIASLQQMFRDEAVANYKLHQRVKDLEAR